MNIHAEVFWLPKGGAREDEYEDAFGPASLENTKSFNDNRIRFAVADGATEASFSKQWAKQLARGFANDRLGLHFTAAELRPLQEKWRRMTGRKQLPWYAEEKVHNGAFSSLLGLEISETRTAEGVRLIWQAVAIGDCCIFHVERGEFKCAWPITKSEFFVNTPQLLCSNELHNGTELSRVGLQKTSGLCGQDSAFYLMTDALSCWFLKAHERGERPWHILADIGTKDGRMFQPFIEDLRVRKDIKNDDVTLLRIEVIGWDKSYALANAPRLQ